MSPNRLQIIRSFFFSAEALRRRERKNLGDTGYLVLSEAPLGFWVIWSRLSKMERSGILDNIRIMRSLRSEVEQIWENAELRHFPHNPCYTRVSGTEWSESAASPLAFGFGRQDF